MRSSEPKKLIMPGSLDPQYHREPGSKWPGFLVNRFLIIIMMIMIIMKIGFNFLNKTTFCNRSGLPMDQQTWDQVGFSKKKRELLSRIEVQGLD